MRSLCLIEYCAYGQEKFDEAYRTMHGQNNLHAQTILSSGLDKLHAQTMLYNKECKLRGTDCVMVKKKFT